MSFFPTLAIEQKKSQTWHALLQTHRFLRTSTIALSQSLDSEVFLETKKKYMYDDAKERLAGMLPLGVLEVLQTFQARSVEDRAWIFNTLAETMDMIKHELKKFRTSMSSFVVADWSDFSGRYDLPEQFTEIQHAQITEHHTLKTFIPSIRPLRGRKSGSSSRHCTISRSRSSSYFGSIAACTGEPESRDQDLSSLERTRVPPACGVG
jgi:hypothetical protein